MHLDPEMQKKIFRIALLALAGILVIVGAVILALGGGGAGKEPTYSGVSIPEDELLVSDIYEGETLIPKFDLPENNYDLKKFKVDEETGFLRYNDANARLGVDVSEYQGNIDWNAVHDAGIDFAILRIGYRGMTQGLLNLDETFEQNFKSAKEAGLFVGVYFFSQAVTEAEAIAEADFVIEALDGRKLAYPVVFDWEQPTPTDKLPASELRAYDVRGSQAAKFGAAFCERIKEAGYKPCVYANKYLAYSFFDLSQWRDYDLWYAEYHNVPSMHYAFRMWQYTESGQVPGITGGVDMNICFKPY